MLEFEVEGVIKDLFSLNSGLLEEELGKFEFEEEEEFEVIGSNVEEADPWFWLPALPDLIPLLLLPFPTFPLTFLACMRESPNLEEEEDGRLALSCCCCCCCFPSAPPLLLPLWAL